MKYTLVFIFSNDFSKVLMIHKTKGPYPGCLNGIGGKIEPTDRDELHGALREVMEETGLSPLVMTPLRFLVKETHPSGTELNVFYTRLGYLARETQIEEEKLEWFKVEELLDVRDRRLAGEGNIPYFINYALMTEGVTI